MLMFILFIMRFVERLCMKIKNIDCVSKCLGHFKNNLWCQTQMKRSIFWSFKLKSSTLFRDVIGILALSWSFERSWQICDVSW